MEQNFSERLKNYRRAKNMTQQELADKLGVSNKTVSRWESGGYPDLGMLVPLARALGVTVDDLLDGEKPIRTLTQADWQNFLSFAFALGGGVLFFLLDLFMPIVLCYLAYLVCMVYGVYLQRHYCYQTRWFRIANAIMNLSVNISMAYRCVSALSALALTLPSLINWEFLTLLVSFIHWYLGIFLLLGFLLAIIATAVTLYLTDRETFTLLKLRPIELYPRRPALRELLPALCVIPLAVFFMVYTNEGFQPIIYKGQEGFYTILLGILSVLCVLPHIRRGHRRGLIPSAVLLAGGLALPKFGTALVYRVDFEKISVASDILQRQAQEAPHKNYLFYTGSGELFVAAGVLLLLCVAVTLVGLRRKPPCGPDPSENASEP